MIWYVKAITLTGSLKESSTVALSSYWISVWRFTLLTWTLIASKGSYYASPFFKGRLMTLKSYLIWGQRWSLEFVWIVITWKKLILRNMIFVLKVFELINDPLTILLIHKLVMNLFHAWNTKENKINRTRIERYTSNTIISKNKSMWILISDPIAFGLRPGLCQLCSRSPSNQNSIGLQPGLCQLCSLPPLTSRQISIGLLPGLCQLCPRSPLTSHQISIGLRSSLCQLCPRSHWGVGTCQRLWPDLGGRGKGACQRLWPDLGDHDAGVCQQLWPDLGDRGVGACQQLWPDLGACGQRQEE